MTVVGERDAEPQPVAVVPGIVPCGYSQTGSTSAGDVELPFDLLPRVPARVFHVQPAGSRYSP